MEVVDRCRDRGGGPTAPLEQAEVMTPQETITWWAIASAFGGSIIGGTISAVVAFIIQHRSLKATKVQRAADKLEQRKALALTVLTKMIRIASTLEILKTSLDNAFKRAERDGIKTQPWMIVIPIATLPGKVHFESEELTEVMRLDFNLFNDLGPFDDVHNVLLDTFAIYRADRTALSDNFSADMVGNLGTTTLTPDDVKKYGPRMASLNTLVSGMIERTRVDSAEAWQILDRLQQALNKQYSLNLRLERKPLLHQKLPPDAKES
jgi:hypothetical protein